MAGKEASRGKAMIRRAARLVTRQWNLHRLAREDSRLASAIRHHLKGALTPDEQRVVDGIERLRVEVNASTSPLTRANYGAGDRASTRRTDEMQADVEVAETVGHFSRSSSKSPAWCRLLFTLVRDLRPTSCIEMGTAVGISGAHQAAALSMNGAGRLTTLEGSAALAEIARENFRRLHVQATEVVVGRFQDTLACVLAAREPVDYVFVDGHHDEQATISYFRQILPFLTTNALMVFDDIAWSDGMQRAWQVIADDRRVKLAVDLGQMGLCVIDRASAGGRRFRIPVG
jgi:predicted O-methyltransferase YrrM